ncbi:unnamed protein product [Adineta steineri]|uniref:GSKIP domain-containing protein n=1 Tax=Adineta steineri TaxID=433720 RepID=A0A815H7P9_9BILA|nr:unnamed protein product [Adineta steineri]CAF1441887.1 unnamed protein product [Adineta steineri]CAF3758365.1 unnamed protein product [Adineta steineri]CAF3858910.1 unnamed protein product [Adineta steineri]
MSQPSAGEQGDFLAEAQLAINDVGDGIVATKQLSKSLNNPSDISTAYINIKSKANKEFCIELSQQGYRIVGDHFDDKSQPSKIYYESLQALLTNESKSYVNSFAESLQQKLVAAQHKIEQEQDENDQ